MFYKSRGNILPRMNIFLCILYLLQFIYYRIELIHINYFEQVINMTHFVKATENDVHMYAKFEYLYVHKFLIKSFKI
jgi:hypothetical protein